MLVFTFFSTLFLLFCWRLLLCFHFDGLLGKRKWTPKWLWSVTHYSKPTYYFPFHSTNIRRFFFTAVVFTLSNAMRILKIEIEWKWKNKTKQLNCEWRRKLRNYYFWGVRHIDSFLLLLLFFRRMLQHLLIVINSSFHLNRVHRRQQPLFNNNIIEYSVDSKQAINTNERKVATFGAHGKWVTNKLYDD